jgi:hypothetical protein
MHTCMHMPYYTPTLCGTSHTNGIAEAKEWQLHYTRDSATTITHTRYMTPPVDSLTIKAPATLKRTATCHLLVSTRLRQHSATRARPHVPVHTPGSYSRQDNCYATWQPGRHSWRPECQGGYSNASDHQGSRRHPATQCSLWHTQAPAHQF